MKVLYRNQYLDHPDAHYLLEKLKFLVLKFNVR
jgi:hypothetical protein